MDFGFQDKNTHRFIKNNTLFDEIKKAVSYETALQLFSAYINSLESMFEPCPA